MIGKPSSYNYLVNRDDLTALNAINQGGYPQQRSPERAARNPLKVDDIQGASSKSSYLKPGTQKYPTSQGPQGLSLPSYDQGYQNPPSSDHNRRFQSNPRSLMAPYAVLEDNPPDLLARRQMGEIVQQKEAKMSRNPMPNQPYSNYPPQARLGAFPTAVNNQITDSVIQRKPNYTDFPPSLNPQITDSVVQMNVNISPNDEAYLRNAALFFGVDLQSDSNPYAGQINRQMMDNPNVPRNDSNYQKNAAKFFGITPPPTGYPMRGELRSDANMPSYNDRVYIKNAAKFYGVTPPQTGDVSQAVRGNFGGDQYTSVNDPKYAKNAAKFYGITPPPTGFLQQSQNYQQISSQQINISPNDLAYQANAARFFGVDPPQTTHNNYSQPEVSYNDPVYKKNASKFYGVTPQATGNNFAQENIYSPSYNDPKYQRDAANFYGVTPLPSRGGPEMMQNIGSKNPGSYNDFSRQNIDNAYAKNAAIFFGVSPPNSAGNDGLMARNEKPMANYFEMAPTQGGINPQQDPKYMKNAAKFYGITPPPTGYNYGAGGSPQMMNQYNSYASNKPGLAANARRIFG
ncbi:unnamed protein product [Blepharisma stoltei]|uniref:Uncharacterized protein n=1 Tax=Blepharisma stoltei TaxID=1481888 RepID=A0AAU9JX59_9CILI|nr:unnamed protein product [Blepharisma stoltei]